MTQLEWVEGPCMHPIHKVSETQFRLILWARRSDGEVCQVHEDFKPLFLGHDEDKEQLRTILGTLRERLEELLTF